MSYGITNKSRIAPDAEPLIARLHKYIPSVIRRWAQTQEYTALDQLRNGIRYFDLRICQNKNDLKYYFAHALFCEEVTGPLIEMKNFLEKNPEELIILDCQHFYAFEQEDHVKLSNRFIEIFGHLIYGREDGSLENCSLNEAVSKKKQILLIYRYQGGQIPTKFWYGYHWPTPWPNKVNVSQLRNYLDDSLQNRPRGAGFVTQCVLTPSVKFIIPRFMFSLRYACARPVNTKLHNWIGQQTPGEYSDGEKPTVNVFIADFIEIKNSNFCQIVIDLNKKLIRDDEIERNYIKK